VKTTFSVRTDRMMALIRFREPGAKQRVAALQAHYARKQNDRRKREEAEREARALAERTGMALERGTEGGLRGRTTGAYGA
jgi:hypothetical protein